MKKLLAIGLVLMLILSALAGCGTKGGQKEASAQSGQIPGEPGVPSAEADKKPSGEKETGTEISPEATYQPSGERDDPNRVSPEATASHIPAETGNRISEEAAWQIALEHAGLTKDQVSRSRVELEYDDGVAEYNVEFYVDTTEYEYEIHGETGKILSFERDK